MGGNLPEGKRLSGMGLDVAFHPGRCRGNRVGGGLGIEAAPDGQKQEPRQIILGFRILVVEPAPFVNQILEQIQERLIHAKMKLALEIPLQPAQGTVHSAGHVIIRAAGGFACRGETGL
ncbi:hypothetical protein D3C81_1868660 [compost metagenome]